MRKILVLTNSKDGLHSTEVINQIEQLGNQVVRMNVDEITSGENKLNINYGKKMSIKLLANNAEVDLYNDISSVWFRRPYSYDFKINDPVQLKVAQEEVRDILEGLWMLLHNKFWISNPQSILKSRNKPFVLSKASYVGLSVPKSLITNCPDEAKDFISLGPTVFKPISGYHFEYDKYVKTALTTLIDQNHIKNIRLIKNQHVMLQRYIQKKFEVRTTYVNGAFYTCKFEHPNYYDVVDWRTPENFQQLIYSEIELPEEVEKKTLSLLKQLDLKYAAVDFAVDKNDVYFFLEVNPVGQWLWIEHSTGMNISEALALSLTRR